MVTENSSDPSADDVAATPEEAPPSPVNSEEVVEEMPVEPLETVPVSEEAAEEAGAAGQLLEACPACGTLMNVTDQMPFAQIFCPSCGQSLRARKQFNNYKLTELLGEGGMGSVFKAMDCNLNRFVALKILKKECSANAEERAKLEQEARTTASINHPHVVKVFSFGDDHGQFYLAMELVEKGSLDDLMIIQRRVAEAQILDVGIQIAEGLEAAHARGLIHRDIKPGNILFSDPHTAKLVDFGLAIVMDEAAQARGEIWGTPYYIAPEKLDNLPEDYRSDIYSLGGTLFHAVAGRPPYEAETASMVALKQLKSQPISLQAFAPDVSSETAYVINRMLAKNPDDRYQSYRELIEHLSYARHKLAERSQRPMQPKARVVMETQATKNLAALLSVGLLLVLLLTGVLGYVFRERLFPTLIASSTAYDASETQRQLNAGVQLMANRQYNEAVAEFDRMEKVRGVPQPMRNWIRMNLGLALIMKEDRQKAAELFDAIQNEPAYALQAPENLLANFFIEVSKNLANPDKIIPRTTATVYSNRDFEAFGLLAYGLQDWQNGALEDAGPFLRQFISAVLPLSDEWMSGYKPLAEFFYEDYKQMHELEVGLTKARTPEAAKIQLAKVQQVRPLLQTGSSATDRLDAIEKALLEKVATP